MCGILGIASNLKIQDPFWLSEARDTMVHRGPDDYGEWWSTDGRVGLYHRRLSILDLSPNGHQPMSDDRCGITVIFNGEIYNHPDLRRELIGKGYTFKSSSDTEVIIAAYDAWGQQCLSRFNGMFAFALYDTKRQTIFIARDRAGEKPLYYHYSHNTLQFASELKALLVNPANPRRIDPCALDCYLAMGFVPGDRCILKGYKKLPPAHALTFNLLDGSVQVQRYWKIPEITDADQVSETREKALVDKLEQLLESAVGRQLVADVPVGILLSGGVDSSIITAMAVRNANKVRTFSIGFPNHGSLDETKHARLIARYFGTEHHELMAESATAELIPYLSRQFDEPMVDSSMIPTWLVSNLVRKHCTVALGGDGGDELFGGYPHYSRLLWMKKWLAFIPSFMRHSVSCMAEDFIPIGFKGRNYLQGMKIDLCTGLPKLSDFFDLKTRCKLLDRKTDNDLNADDIYQERIPVQRDIVQRATRMDFNDYLAEDLLVKVDRTSMLNSLEIRAPMLDYNVIEFAFKRVPSYMKATIKNKKILLKRLAERLLPKEFDLQRKQGFSIPISDWLRSGPFREMFWDVLTAPDCMFDRRTVQSLLDWQDKGCNNGERLFTLVLFEFWRKHYRTVL